jgi:GxxExxY protein
MLINSTYDQELYGIIGAAMEVQNELGMGFLELVYHDALNVELGLRGIPYETEKPIAITYKDKPLERVYKADLVCYGNIVVELKSVEKLKAEHTAQLLNYLKATGMPMGILINFGEKPLRYKIVPNYISNN